VSVRVRGGEMISECSLNQLISRIENEIKILK
jgi:hypothetical protein